MLMVKLYSAQLTGLDATIITVEVDLSPGLHIFSIVGLADKEIQESRERIGAAIKNIGGRAPHKKPHRVIVNLAPADIKKEGPAFDLPIALGYLLASDQTKFNPEKKIFLGELGLDGSVKPVRGVLAAAIAAKNAGFATLYVPEGNGSEASLVSGIEIKETKNILELLDDLENKKTIAAYLAEKTEKAEKDNRSDFSLIKGQGHAKRALEITAAGGHNLLMQGPPGTGKTILARTLPSILPELAEEELIEVAKIYSAGGFLKNGEVNTERPFRSPHHTSSQVAIAGGGNPIRPGEITLAHRGVLFLDELPEFQSYVLNSLREPMEDRVITVSRAQGTVAFPAHVILVAAMNPCPCGHLNNPPHECVCTPGQITKYQRKISGPLLDRIDLFIDVPKVEIKKIDEETPDEADNTAVAEARKNVERARRIEKERFIGQKIFTNSEMGLREIKKHCPLTESVKALLLEAYEKHSMSPRSYYRTIKVARTIADLAESESIKENHMLEALQYRSRQEN
ncbi:MAG: YifB family Mg chelatase-like AAA ATPase [Candidatus Sungbacteria bacterium]|nr:YifB family Mg chelatase-like AAA ATPase [Candidatus Sungbacteria bacterium]